MQAAAPEGQGRSLTSAAAPELTQEWGDMDASQGSCSDTLHGLWPVCHLRPPALGHLLHPRVHTKCSSFGAVTTEGVSVETL